MLRAAAGINRRYGSGTVEVEIKDSYRNMAEQIRPHWHLIENAYEAVREVGANPRANQCRAAPTGPGCLLGLPCPNLGTKQSNHPDTLEYASVQAGSMYSGSGEAGTKYAYFTP